MTQAAEGHEGKNKRQRGRRRVTLVLLGILVVAIFWYVWRQERSLLAQAKRIGPVGAWQSTAGIDCPWSWRSDHEILVIRQSEASIWATPRTPQGPLRACLLNMENGQETQLDTLTATLNAQLTQNGKIYLSGPELSPDGRWLLWDTPPYSSPTCFLATSLDGANILRWPKEAGEDYQNLLLWQRDSNAFLRLRYNANGIGLKQAEFRSPHAPGQTQIVALPKNQIGGMALGWTPDGRALLCNSWSSNANSTAYFAAIDVHTPEAPPRLYSLTPPPAREIRSLVLSPDGKRLAWMLRSRPAPPQGPALLRWFQRQTGWNASRNVAELWISNTDGTGMRRIGALPLYSKNQAHLGSCAWSPDGKQLAFAYKNTLYTLPIEFGN